MAKALNERFGPDGLKSEKTRKYKGYLSPDGYRGRPVLFRANETAVVSERFGTEGIGAYSLHPGRPHR